MRLHHIGVVVSDIMASAKVYQELLGFGLCTPIIEDSIQKVKVAFIPCGLTTNITIELIEPVAADSPVANFAKKGGGVYHLCYEVDDIEEQLRLIQERGGKPIQKPVPAVAFNGRRIAFIYSKVGLIELLEVAK